MAGHGEYGSESREGIRHSAPFGNELDKSRLASVVPPRIVSGSQSASGDGVSRDEAAVASREYQNSLRVTDDPRSRLAAQHHVDALFGARATSDLLIMGTAHRLESGVRQGWVMMMDININPS